MEDELEQKVEFSNYQLFVKKQGVELKTLRKGELLTHLRRRGMKNDLERRLLTLISNFAPYACI